VLYALLFVSLAISALEYQRMFHKKEFRDLAVHACFLSVGIVLLVLQLLHIQVPSPLLAIQTFFEPASMLIAKLLS
jgi:hypothetical protein